MYRHILIANRGEIAARIARTCQRLGIAASGIHSAADRDALHVRAIGRSIEVGGAAASDSYLNIANVIAAARTVGADAVHPGYGFLAENPDFVRALDAAGLAFIGPDAETIAAFGDKAEAKRRAKAAGLAIMGGSEGALSDRAAIEAAAGTMPLPLLLKAAAGGGGKGMRRVDDRAEIGAAAEAAMREARSAFGDGRLIIEPYVTAARHVEVQILGDGKGGVIHLLDRECTLQRRHQKVIEEAPVLSLEPALRQRLLDDAVRLGQSVRYRGLGTVEFIVSNGAAWFLEVNPRLQVEHPVTEAITGLDLVELQILACAEGRLVIAQKDVLAKGVAIEARLYAEDPQQNFMPSAGRVVSLSFPPGLRIDAGIASGMDITSHYDPMIAKLIAAGPDRATALAHLRAGLNDVRLSGPANNLGFLARLLAHADVTANRIDTGFIDRHLEDLAVPKQPTPADAAIAAALWLRARRMRDAQASWHGWNELMGWRLGDGSRQWPEADSLRLSHGEQVFGVRFGALDASGHVMVVVEGVPHRIRITPDGSDFVVQCDQRLDRLSGIETADGISLCRDGAAFSFTVSAALALGGGEGGAGDGLVRAPMMGKIIVISAEPGQMVAKGQRLAALESMKMELGVVAPAHGRVAAVECRVDNMVERDQVLFRIEPAPGSA